MSLNTPIILEAAVAAARGQMPAMRGDCLDIGSGHGELIGLLRAAGEFRFRACDYTTELMKLDGVKVDVVDLNTQPLPYPDASFDLVTCTEVIEHVEHYRRTLREIHRVLRPGGVAVVTTPNILNLKSRLRSLFFGFPNLFGPLHVRESRLYSTGGHINPVSYFYLAHSLLDAGFDDLRFSIDKQQKGYLPFAVLFAPWIQLYAWRARSRERTKYRTLDDANEPHVRAMNSWPMLLGRTIVVSCRKAKA